MSIIERKKILIVGCGNLGQHLAGELIREGHSVTAARRSVSRLPDSLDAITMDVTRPDSFAAFESQSWDALVITLTARGEEAYRQVYVEGVRNILSSLSRRAQKPLVLFVSSTSVYHQNDGSFIDEYSETNPEGYSGKTMLAAEALLKSSGLPFAVVRMSGIYGNYHSFVASLEEKEARGGHLLKVLQDGRMCPTDPVRYSNRIHINDCVGVLRFLIGRYFAGNQLSPVYLASDGNPVPLNEVMSLIAEINQIETQALVPDYCPDRGGNKRCAGKLLKEQGYQMQFPDYKAGYNR